VPTDTSAGFTGPTQLVLPVGTGRRVVVYRVTDPDTGVRFGAVPLADD
jgi:hypothetical protein